MLTLLRKRLAFHRQAIVSSLKSLGQKPLATFMTVAVIALTFALPALFWVLTDNMKKLTTDWQHSGHISLFLQPQLGDEAETALLLRIQQMAGVGQAKLKTAAEGLAELKQQEGMEDIMLYLPDNPLPSVIEVAPALAINSPAQLHELFLQLKANPQVAQAKIDMEWVKRLHAGLDFITRLAQGLMILLGAAVVLIIGNTLRLAIQKNYNEIQILKLIGATNSFIRRPFLYTGLWYGLAGGIFAVILVNLFILSLSVAANQLTEVYQLHTAFSGLALGQILFLITTAIILGWLGASLSIRRQLASIQPYQ